MNANLNNIAGREIEITVRGDRSFTFSFDAIDRKAVNAITSFLGKDAKLEVEEDEECGTFIYCEV